MTENITQSLVPQEMLDISVQQQEAGKNGHNNMAVLERPKEYKLTEFGNMERMLDQFGHNIRWNKAFGYCVWDGKRWVIDQEKLVERYAWLTIRGIYRDIATLSEIARMEDDDKKRTVINNQISDLTRHVRNSENRVMVTNMVKLACSHCMLDQSAFDQHQYLFNFMNGTLNLQTEEFYSHRREDFITFLCPHNYNLHAQAPLFTSFFDDILIGDEELKAYLQKALGYSLTANTKEEVWFQLVGQGENGKTTLMDAIMHAMGEYSTVIDEKTISVTSGSTRDGGTPSPDIARLKGLRLGVVRETEEGSKAASSRLKDMATGERVTARYLNKNNFEFYYTHKLFVYTNHPLVVHDTSHGFWRRVRMMPFDYRVPADKKDKDLVYKLYDEAEGILAWLVQGEFLRSKEGLQDMPRKVQEATKQYRESQDTLGQFIKEYCILDKHASVAASEIQAKFKEWLEEQEIKRFSMPTFKRMLLDHGVKWMHTRNGKAYSGIRLRTGEELNEVEESVTLVTDVTPFLYKSSIENSLYTKDTDKGSQESQESQEQASVPSLPGELVNFHRAMQRSKLDKVFMQHPQGNRYIPIQEYIKFIDDAFLSDDSAMQKWASEQIAYRIKN